MTRHVKILIAACLMQLAQPISESGAVVQRNPDGVNVSSTGPTTLVIRFSDDSGSQFTTGEAQFCSRLQANNSCDPSSIIGRLPASLDRGSTSAGTSAISDVMTIPNSVTRRAVVNARGGNFSDFFYERRFSPVGGADLGAGAGNDVFVFVTCRLTAGISRSPLSLTRVELFGQEPSDSRVQLVRIGANNLESGKVKADIDYTGLCRWRSYVECA